MLQEVLNQPDRQISSGADFVSRSVELYANLLRSISENISTAS